MRRPLLVSLGLLIAMALAGCGTEGVQPTPTTSAAGGMTHQPGMTHDTGMTHSAAMNQGDAAQGQEGGQAAFAAIQEVVALLEADPDTNWTTVNLSALHQHLVDMDEVTLRATVAERDVDGGTEATVTGAGRTLEAIGRMVATHAQFLDGYAGWTVQARNRADGVVLTVTTTSPEEVDHIRGLGFYGLMATQSHHQEHHLLIATGQGGH